MADSENLEIKEKTAENVATADGTGVENPTGAPHKKRRILLIVLLVLAAVLVGTAVSVFAMDKLGQSSLHKEAAAPTLEMTEAENGTSDGTDGAGNVAADGTSDGAASDGTVPDQAAWKEGWIGYNGKVYEYNSDLMTFLFMGIDDMSPVSAKSGYRNGKQADALFLLVMDPTAQQFTVVAVHRNTMADFDMYDENGAYEGRGHGQLCLAHEFGDGLESSCENEEKAVSGLFYNLPINGYVSLNMGAIAKINDAIGGVSVPKMTYEDGKIVYGDAEMLYGEDAYNYICVRGEDFDSATYRLEKQKVYLRAFARKLTEAVKSDPAIAVTLFQTAGDYMVTDVTVPQIIYLAGSIANYSLEPKIYSLEGTTTVGEQGYEEFNPDEDALRDLMIKVFYREVSEEELKEVEAGE